jgi:hypothetical protein
MTPSTNRKSPRGRSRPMSGKLPWMLLGASLLAAPAPAQQATWYVSVVGSDSNAGTSPSAPLKSVAKGIGLAAQGGGGTVKLTAGRFDEPALSLPAKVALEGNWSRDFATQKGFSARTLLQLKADDDVCTSWTCLTSGRSDRTVTLAGAGSALRQLAVVGPDRRNTPGSNSYGVLVDGVDATLSFVVVKAGTAAAGMNGQPGPGGGGLCTGGGGGGWVKVNSGSGVFDNWCEPQNGAQGQTLQLYGRTANGGGGGKPGASNCSAWPSTNGVTDGATGGPGDAGIEGPPGAAAAADQGGFARSNGALDWTSATTGGHGQAGSPGAGGGGGGPGGSWGVIYWCLVGYPIVGGHGHSGSAGGCGGGGGGGGHSGGGAFALVVNEGTVTAEELVLFGGAGGTGGKGNDGGGGAGGAADDAMGQGGSSTNGCTSSTTSRAGTGGRGGHGGKGGGGGGGAGGNGGPSFTLVTLGTGRVKVAREGGVYRVAGGQAGGGGGGGFGADSRTQAPGGNNGLTAETVKLDLRTAAPRQASREDD